MSCVRKRLAVATVAVLIISLTGGASYATGKGKGDPGGGGGGGKGQSGSATMTGDFDNNCTEFDGESDKDISNVQVFYTDGTSSKEEFRSGKKSYSHDAPDGKQIDYVVVKSGTKSQTFRCPECQDGKDNKDPEDTVADEDDPGCRNPDGSYNEDDPDETDSGTKPQCSDGVDNADAEDTKADADDPGCRSNPDGSYNPNDPDETDPAGPKPECSDGVDNADTEDTKADRDDPGCLSGPGGAYNPDDPDETDPAGPKPECSDGVDNADAEDTVADANDPGCRNPDGTYNPNDPDETDPTGPRPECSDGVDNADPEDTVADAADPGCRNPDGTYNPLDPSEVDNTQPPGGRFSCRASTLRIEHNLVLETLTGEPEFEPFVANADNDPCEAGTGTLIDTEDVLSGPPGTLRVRALEAETTGGPTAATGAGASSSIGRVRVTDADGVEVLSARVVGSSATASCVGGDADLDGESSIVSLRVDGEPIDVGAEEQEIPIEGVGVLHLNYQEEAGGVLTQRAIFLDTEDGNPIGDVIVAESIVDVHGDPCP